MKNNQIVFHPYFLDVFTVKELEDIIKYATVVTKKCIVIATEDYFFELSADIGNKLDIYCDRNKNGTQQKVTKDEFIKLYKISPLLKVEHIHLDE